METTTITIAGQELLGAVDKDGCYYIAIRELEKSLDWKQDSTREKLKSKSLKAFSSKDIPPVKRRVGESFMNFISIKDLSVLLTWAALD